MIYFSLHLKATMMKVSDPIMFAVQVYFKDVFEKHGKTFDELGVDPRNGLGDVYAKLEKLPADQKAVIEQDIKDTYAKRPRLAMVNSDKGITNSTSKVTLSLMLLCLLLLGPQDRCGDRRKLH